VKPADDVSYDDSARGRELMPFDDGSLSADKAQSSAMSLVINYGEPGFAAGTAVFGLNLLVLPMLARLGLAGNPAAVAAGGAEDDCFSYGREESERLEGSEGRKLFTSAELRQRLGLLDAASVRRELTMNAEELEEHISQCGADATDGEVSRMQKWRDKVNANLKSLQKRSALAFLGLPPEASESDINKMYKKMALELHPDKGGDPEKFQELQEMKVRLNEIDDEKKEGLDEDDEEARKAKEKAKAEEEETAKLPPCDRIKKLRIDAHDNTVRLWEKAKKSRDEIVGDKAIKSNAQPALNLFRSFVERFVSSEIKSLRHDDAKGAEAKFRKFVKQGAEIMAIAAMQDVQATLSTLATSFNYRLVARSGSADVQRRCAALLEAVSEVPVRVEAFLKQLDDSLAESKERERREKEARAAAQREREAKGDFSGDGGTRGGSATSTSPAPLQKPSAEVPPPEAPSAASGPAAQGPKAGTGSAPKGGSDPFADFDFGPVDPKGPGAPKTGSPPKSTPASTIAVVRKDEQQLSATEAPPKRWDPTFDHPYAGALKSNGTGIFCRACQRFIQTYEYNIEVFYTHVQRAHPKPPPGWAG